MGQSHGHTTASSALCPTLFGGGIINISCLWHIWLNTVWCQSVLKEVRSGNFVLSLQCYATPHQDCDTVQTLSLQLTLNTGQHHEGTEMKTMPFVLHLLRYLHSRTTARVCIQNCTPGVFCTTSGVCRGCVLVPATFCCAVDQLMCCCTHPVIQGHLGRAGSVMAKLTMFGINKTSVFPQSSEFTSLVLSIVL